MGFEFKRHMIVLLFREYYTAMNVKTTLIVIYSSSERTLLAEEWKGVIISDYDV